MNDDAGEILFTAFLGVAPDEDAADLEQGVIEANRALSNIGTLRPVETIPGPDGSRAVDPATAGEVCATLLPAVPDLLAVLKSLLAWATRRRGRSVTVIRPDGSRIDLVGLSETDQHLLIEDWIRAGRAA